MIEKRSNDSQQPAIGFTQNRLVRDSEKRGDHSLAKALNDNKARYYLFCGRDVLTKQDRQILFTRKDAEKFDADFDQSILLGWDEKIPHLASPVKSTADSIKPPWALSTVRQVLYSQNFADHDQSVGAGAIAQASALLSFHFTNQFCGRFGAKNIAKIGGYRRDCTKCEHQIFPRTDPAVIMLISRGEKCLLGRSPHFQPGWFSTLAGFVEPGETIEDAVRREVFEESGIKVGKVSYFASQPWPFPHSLMIGAFGEALSEKISFDDDELEDCRWFSRNEVCQMINNTHKEGLICPPSKSISSALIGHWANHK